MSDLEEWSKVIDIEGQSDQGEQEIKPKPTAKNQNHSDN